MSLNTAHAQGGVLIFCGERILIHYDGVEMTFDMPGEVSHFKGTKKGRVYLTTHRVIFNSKSTKDLLQSFSMPFFTLRELELEQPVFGANYIKGKVIAEPNGNWSGEGRFKMWFNHGGAIEFGQAMLHAGKMASRYFTAQPPVYTVTVSDYYQAPPPSYAPPGGPNYAFVPYQLFPEPPPQNGVYMSSAPPPYPGIDPNLSPCWQPPVAGYAASGLHEPPVVQSSSAAAKAAEAAASEHATSNRDYYPQGVHLPNSPPEYSAEASSASPPPYSEANKKSD